MEFLNGFVKTNIAPTGGPSPPGWGRWPLHRPEQPHRGLWPDTPHEGHQRDGGPGLMSMFLIYGAQFRYNGLAGGLKKFAEPMPLLIPHQPDGGGHPAPGAVYAPVRQHSGRLHHHGDAQAAGAGGAAGGVQPLLRPVDGLIQTVVFVFLTTLFTGEGIKEED